MVAGTEADHELLRRTLLLIDEVQTLRTSLSHAIAFAAVAAKHSTAALLLLARVAEKVGYEFGENEIRDLLESATEETTEFASTIASGNADVTNEFLERIRAERADVLRAFEKK